MSRSSQTAKGIEKNILLGIYSDDSEEEKSDEESEDGRVAPRIKRQKDVSEAP